MHLYVIYFEILIIVGLLFEDKKYYNCLNVDFPGYSRSLSSQVFLRIMIIPLESTVLEEAKEEEG